ncbi:MAG: ATP-binding cassette domain-containing protein [Clostridium sp.]|nr:ATP-binding cassette domain-containing protein [Clostridium sp.]
MKIELKNVTKKFDKIEVIKNTNIVFESGHIYGLHGRNGSGKSVLMKLICGFYMPTTGEILFDNVNFNAKNEYPKDLRAVIEKPTFFPDLTGYENLKVLARIQNKITDKEILESLETVNLIQEKDKKYSKYSLGMKQKLAIAQAIMEDPKVLILDEPFNGIEEKSVEKITKYLKQKKKEDKLIIFSTHIKEDLNNLADTIFHIDDGVINND